MDPLDIKRRRLRRSNMRLKWPRFDERQTIDHLAEAGEPDFRSGQRHRRRRSAALRHAGGRSRPAARPPRPWIDSISRIHRAQPTGGVPNRRHVFQPKRSMISARASQFSVSADIRELLRQRGRGDGLCAGDAMGDLHLENIVLIECKPVLFDAIEFDPIIASVDVLYDPCVSDHGFHSL